MKHLLSYWSEVSARLAGAGHILLLMDYDGTLTPIVDRPEDANLPGETKKALRALSQLPAFTIGIISGRSLASVKEMVGLSDVIYAGNHGLEIEDAMGAVLTDPSAEKARPIIRELAQRLTSALEQITGASVEDKGLTLSVHYRLVDERDMPEVNRILKQIAYSAQLPGDIRITHGKKVLEVRPAVDVDKGDAVERIVEMRKQDICRCLPVYIGDDQTDEDGFRAVERYANSMSVFVGEASWQSSACYFLNSPAEVTTFLVMLLEQAQVDSVIKGGDGCSG
jgi:trehalose 6-phosphate phosphatase